MIAKNRIAGVALSLLVAAPMQAEGLKDALKGRKGQVVAGVAVVGAAAGAAYWFYFRKPKAAQPDHAGAGASSRDAERKASAARDTGRGVGAATGDLGMRIESLEKLVSHLGKVDNGSVRVAQDQEARLMALEGRVSEDALQQLRKDIQAARLAAANATGGLDSAKAAMNGRVQAAEAELKLQHTKIAAIEAALKKAQEDVAAQLTQIRGLDSAAGTHKLDLATVRAHAAQIEDLQKKLAAEEATRVTAQEETSELFASHDARLDVLEGTKGKKGGSAGAGSTDAGASA